MPFFAGLCFALSAFFASEMPAWSQTFANTPAGYTNYMGWFPGDAFIFVSDSSRQYYYIEKGKIPRRVWGKDRVVVLDGGVVLAGGHPYCKGSDLDLLPKTATGRIFAECTRRGWVKRD